MSEKFEENKPRKNNNLSIIDEIRPKRKRNFEGGFYRSRLEMKQAYINSRMNILVSQQYGISITAGI